MKLKAFWPWLLLSKVSAPQDTNTAEFKVTELTLPLKHLLGFGALAAKENIDFSASLTATSPNPYARNLMSVDRPIRLNRARSVRHLRQLDHSFLISGLHRFGEQLSGSAFNLLILRNLLEVAHPQWVLEILFFQSRLTQLFSLSRTRSVLPITSPSHSWYGGPQVIVSSICARDPFLLTQWITKRMGTMKLFAHRRFLRLLGSFLRAYVSLTPSSTTILGFNFVTTGKISVTGNAMSRTMLVRFGKAGINNLSYRASSAFTLINTKTGCLGLNLVFYY